MRNRKIERGKGEKKGIESPEVEEGRGGEE
jgi:hypothetical protein